MQVRNLWIMAVCREQRLLIEVLPFCGYGLARIYLCKWMCLFCKFLSHGFVVDGPHYSQVK